MGKPRTTHDAYLALLYDWKQARLDGRPFIRIGAEDAARILLQYQQMVNEMAATP